MGQLHILFFPFMAQGHILPLAEMASLFASRGVRATILTTPLNALALSSTVEKARKSGFNVSVHLLDFPSAEAGLPEGVENVIKVTSPEMAQKFFNATTLLRQPLELVLENLRPDCLVADMFFPWAHMVAEKFGIPRLVFHGSSFFAWCTMDSVRRYRPFETASSDDEPFAVPNLPHEIKMTREQIPAREREEAEASTDMAKLLKRAHESVSECYGVIFNSFYELEPDYANHYRNVLKMKAWHVGPVSLCNRRLDDREQRGTKAAIEDEYCLQWLDSKAPNSVLYLCFGSVAKISDAQYYEIAMGLEASGHQFIWVVRREKNKNGTEKWLPEGFEDRMKEIGLVVRGWAPQVRILEHKAVGGFLTHCGWNSILEGVCAEVPMATWPVMAEQFCNEKLVAEVLGIGVPVGAKRWTSGEGDGVAREEVEKAVRRVMAGPEAEEMRRRVRALGETARTVVEEGGSSFADLNALLDELSLHRPSGP